MTATAEIVSRRVGERDMLPFRLEGGIMRNCPFQFIVYDAAILTPAGPKKVSMTVDAGSPGSPSNAVGYPLAHAILSMLETYWALEKDYDLMARDKENLVSENAALKGEIDRLRREVLSARMKHDALAARHPPREAKKATNGKDEA